MPDRLVSIVTVTHQSFHCLERLRKSLRAHTRAPYEWIIVDNGSARPETIKLLEAIEAADEARVIWNAENRWFTEATNQGLAKAGGDHLVLLNPDCEVTPGWLQAMLRVNEQPHCGIVGAVLVNEDGRVVHAGARGEGHHDGFGELYRPDAPWAQDRQHDGWITGACLLISRPALEAVGGALDLTFRHYHSDMKLGQDVRGAGFKIWMSSHVLVHSMARADW